MRKFTIIRRNLPGSGARYRRLFDRGQCSRDLVLFHLIQSCKAVLIGERDGAEGTSLFQIHHTHAADRAILLEGDQLGIQANASAIRGKQDNLAAVFAWYKGNAYGLASQQSHDPPAAWRTWNFSSDRY